MDVFKDFTHRVTVAVETLARELDVSLPQDLRITVEPPRDPAHGDIATNAAMLLGKVFGAKPRDLAEAIGERLAGGDVTSVEIAGPGFINLRLAPSYWLRVLSAVVDAGEVYGNSTMGGGERVNVEYVSANPTGPMHVGHCRGAVVGDALANLLEKAGYDVTREYYINDAGAQVDVLARSAHMRYREACGEAIGTIPEGLYPGDYLKPVGQAIREQFGESLLEKREAEWLEPVRETTIHAMMEMIREDLAALGIVHDVFFSEQTLTRGSEGDLVAETIADLRQRGLIYEGRLPPPKGQLPDDWEDREQTLFRATEFGDDVDRPLMKSDGSYTYFANDIAYHRNKYLRGFRRMIDVWGADHGGYVKRMTSAVKAISNGEAGLEVRLCQLVKLFRAGEPVRMSKRAGDFVTLRDVTDEVGRDVVRFMMLMRKSDAPLDFDFAKVVEQSKDNPVFYVQYAHARCKSIFRNAADVFAGISFPLMPLAGGELESIAHEADLALVRKLAEFPRLIESAAESGEPHRVAFYLYDLASSFHALWTQGKDMPQLRFIHEDSEQMTIVRLHLVAAVTAVVAAGLRVLGVRPAEEMR
ncbi:MAG: arginine--tRNA ligase [Rhodobiaceae bacterium]|nr:arginine--tRNA ligase [Rhodobiaceae bacterium]MCC0041539.1 arginine--tRNA ligase [Rhodobiaceae bacterium]